MFLGKSFFDILFYFILLYNTVLVLPYSDMNPPWVYMSSQSWTPFPPPSPYHLSGNDNPVCETAKETQRYRTDFWTLRERERVGWLGRMALKHVYYHVRNESPVYVWYRIQDAWGWCTGMIQRDDMEWELGGGFRIGNSRTPVADSCQCTAKPIQYCKVKKIKKRRHI